MIWLLQRTYFIWLGAYIGTTGAIEAVLSTGAERKQGILVSIIGWVIGSAAYFVRDWLNKRTESRRLEDELEDAEPEFVPISEFVDQSDESNADVLGLVASAITHGRVASAAAGADVVPSPAAQAAFMQDMMIGTRGKTPAELRAMVITAVDIASQSLFVSQHGSEDEALELVRRMALALKAADADSDG